MSEKIVSVDKGAVKRKAHRAGKRVASYVSGRVASTQRAAKQKVKQAPRGAVRAVARRVASMGDAVMRRPMTHDAATKILDAAIEISRKQQSALEKLKSRLY